MKKLLIVILAMALLLPAVTLADPDPIVGAWYVFYDANVHSEVRTWINGCDSSLFIFYFDESGDIYQNTISRTYLNFAPASTQIGKWAAGTDGHYVISIVGRGETFDAYFDNEDMIAQLGGDQTYFRIRKIVVLNPYVDLMK